MDFFDRAFESVGVNTESLNCTHEKLNTEAESLNMTINKETERTQREEALFYGLSNADRDQAVYEKIIPAAYRDACFDENKIKSNIKTQYQKSGGLYKVYKFKDYTDICNTILSSIRMKRLPDRSYIIGAPNGFGKTSFVNECLITLRRQGYRVAPYISLWELAQLRVDNEHRIMDPYKRFKKEGSDVVYKDPNTVQGYMKIPTIVTTGYSYSEYINADCLFVCFTDVISKDIESHTLYQLLNIRGAKGLPTIVMISTSLEPYENDRALKEYVWDEIKDYDENKKSYDRVYHISCFKKKALGLDNKNEVMDKDTGIIL